MYGRVAWRDKTFPNDLLIVSALGLPPEPGQVYAAWLVGTKGSLTFGALKPGDDGIMTVFYVSPDSANPLGSYERVSITKALEADKKSLIGRPFPACFWHVSCGAVLVLIPIR